MSKSIASHENRKSNTGHIDNSQREILYNGYFYNVTDFIGKHPGGNIINFYTDGRDDATQAIEQFHYHSKQKVEAIMSTLKKRVAPADERGLAPNDLLRHELLSKDFRNLCNELEAEGYFEPSISHVIIRLVEAAAVSFLAFGLFFYCEAVPAKFLCTIFCGYAMLRFGFIQHEAGHNSLTGRPIIDKMIQDICMCFALCNSATWWNSKHNKHHAMTQRLERDRDVATLPYVAFNKRAVKQPKDVYTFFIKYQGILYWTVDLFVVPAFLRFVTFPRFQLRKKAYKELLLAIPSLWFYMCMMGPVWFLLTWYWNAVFLALTFAISHSHLDVTDEPNHWIEYALLHTTNLTPSIFDYFTGYLSYQIEHHLFPTMPEFRQKQICHRVKALAERHGLPYRVISYHEAVALTIKNLSAVGKQLSKTL